MITLSTIPLNDVRKVWSNDTSSNYAESTTSNYRAFLIWPSFLVSVYSLDVLSDGGIMVLSCRRWSLAFCKCNQIFWNSRKIFGNIDYMADVCCVPTNFWAKARLLMLIIMWLVGFVVAVLQAIVRNFNSSLCITYMTLVVLWEEQYERAGESQVYLLAAALITGWLYTIVFLRGFQSVDIFIIMLRYMIINDVFNIALVYSVFLAAVGTALNALFQISPVMIDTYPTIWHVLYATFAVTVGLEEIVSKEVDDEYKMLDSNSIYIRLIVISYIVFSTIILLNLLIAKMSDTYTEVREREGANWRVDSVRQALAFERRIPYLGRLFRHMRRMNLVITFDKPSGCSNPRCYITVLREDGTKELPNFQSDLTRHMSKFENRLRSMEDRVETQNSQLLERLDKLLHMKK